MQKMQRLPKNANVAKKHTTKKNKYVISKKQVKQRMLRLQKMPRMH